MQYSELVHNLEILGYAVTYWTDLGTVDVFISFVSLGLISVGTIFKQGI